ncbi:MAG TPA: response regulator [Macromonas sp.]|nr:response regulator [Macromonas sp.]
MLRTSGLILIALVVFALGSYRLLVRPTVQGLAQAEMGLVSEQVDARIQYLLGSVEVTLRSSRSWGLDGALDHNQVWRFNEFFFPIIGHHPEISSVNFAHESGREILLLHTADGKWVNRLSDPQRWGRQTFWLTWGEDHQLEKVEMRELDYDTRKRPWFQGAMALASTDAIHWTDPYIFFTTKEPGITAAMRWRGRDGSTYVIGHDVKLLDLSRFTSTLQLGQQGQAALMKADGTLIALPRDPKLDSDQALKAAVLKTAQEDRLPAVAAGHQAWVKQGYPSNTVMHFEHGGSTWFGLFRPAPVGAQRLWLTVFAPENEFIPATASDVVMLGFITVAALSLGSLVAMRMARRMAAPLEALTRDSERIGRMELHEPVSAEALNAPWEEVYELARAQETMRHQLRQSSHALAQANEQLEAKVAERTQAALQQKALLEALLDVIPNAIFYKGADSRFLGCNQAYEAAFGVSRASFIGKRVLDLDYLPEAARAAFQAEDEAIIRSMGRLVRREALTFADGQMHHTLYSVTAFANPDGSPGGLIGVIVDVSELTRAEAAAREARAQAEAAASAKADFLANMSHEIRTPMNAVIGMTELALMTELSLRQRGYLEKAHAAASSLLRLINDILDFSKIEAGKMSCEQAEFRLETVLKQVADMASLRIRDKDLELIFDVDVQVPDVLVGDALRLGQVLTNLVGNAVKFTEHGEVTVKVQLQAGPPDLACLHFDVCDTGIGMSEAELARVFQAFAQADNSTTRRYGGTGLGLSISKRIVELLGGEIRVRSTQGQGSCFDFTLCFALPTTQPAQVPALLRHHVQAMPVLVVDDNAAAREVFVHTLQAMSFPVEAVASGPEALSELERARQAGQPYRVLLIDWKMPGMDGVETLRRVRALFQDPRPICLMATAHDLDSLTQALDGTAADGLLSKPVTASTLLDAIMNAGRHLDAPALGAALAPQTLPMEDMRQVLEGSAVLLVEDNDTNQELAQELLAQVGIQADVAANGAEALAWLARKDFGLVLMDCQMPVMDGYEATRRLRQELGLTRLPVVAMTANALAGEREKCLAAGMNDYLDKPIHTQRFYATLMHWLAPGRWPEQPGEEAAAPASDVLAQLDRAGALMRMGQDEALYERLLQRFAEREADAAERLQALLAGRRQEDAQRLVHNIKGLAGNIGAQALAQACRVLEGALPGPQSARDSAFNHWKHCLQAVLSQLRADAAVVPPSVAEAAADAPLDMAALHALCITLAETLEDNDLRASRQAQALVQALARHPEAEAAQQLARWAAQYDYDHAAAALRELAARLHIQL